MKCPICNKRPRVYPSVQTRGVVEEWCAACQGKHHVVVLYSSTRGGLDARWPPHNKAFHANRESRAAFRKM